MKRLPAILLLLAAPVSADGASGAPPLTRYLLLTDVHLTPAGGAIWFRSGERFEGRVHTNGQFRFAGNPEFADTATSGSETCWFYNHGTPVERASDHNGTIDVPRFERGLVRGAAPVLLPGHDHDQRRAALGLEPDGTPPSNAEVRAQLGLTPGPHPPPEGIYLVHAGLRVTGGIHVQGSADLVEIRADTVSRRQEIRIRRGAAERIATIDPAAGTTTWSNGASASVYAGLPRGVVYVTGSVADLRGPGRAGGVPLPALLDGQRWLVAAGGDVTLGGDATVERGLAGGAVLGIFASGGSVRVAAGAPDDLALDAFLVAAGPLGAFEVEGAGAGEPRGTLHLRGGCVARRYGAFGAFGAGGVLVSGYARDFRHDGRGLVPPWYPESAPATARVPDREPAGVRLDTPRPQPSRGWVSVRFSIRIPGRVRLALHDLLGRRVATWMDADLSAGEHHLRHRTGGALRPGVHLLRLEAPGGNAAVRLVVL